MLQGVKIKALNKRVTHFTNIYHMKGKTSIKENKCFIFNIYNIIGLKELNK